MNFNAALRSGLVAAALSVGALAAPAPALAQSQSALTLESIVELEKSVPDENGANIISYEPPKVVVPGDRVRISLNYRNAGTAPIADVKLRNPMHAALAFDGTADLDGFTVSVDGGTTWGQLASLMVKAVDGTERPANNADITHVMWILTKPVAPGASGSVTFFGRVR